MYPISTGIKNFKKITLLLPVKSHSLCFSNIGAEKVPSDSSILAEKLAYSLDWCYDVRYLRKIHACTIIQGLGTNSFLGSKLVVNNYTYIGLLSESRSVFSRIINDSFFVWNSVFVGYFRAGEFDEVLRVYLSFRQRNIGLNGSAFTFSLKGCVDRNLESLFMLIF
ncbi:hypothetical protein R6Q59_008300 [Mikania micrantha]